MKEQEALSETLRKSKNVQILRQKVKTKSSVEDGPALKQDEIFKVFEMEKHGGKQLLTLDHDVENHARAKEKAKVTGTRETEDDQTSDTNSSKCALASIVQKFSMQCSRASSAKQEERMQAVAEAPSQSRLHKSACLVINGHSG